MAATNAIERYFSGQGRTWLVTATVSAVALAIAIGGALAMGSGSGIDPVNLFVEGKLSGTRRNSWAASSAHCPICLRRRNGIGGQSLRVCDVAGVLGPLSWLQPVRGAASRAGGIGAARAGRGCSGVRRIHPAVWCRGRRGWPVGILYQRSAPLAGPDNRRGTGGYRGVDGCGRKALHRDRRARRRSFGNPNTSHWQLRSPSACHTARPPSAAPCLFSSPWWVLVAPPVLWFRLWVISSSMPSV